MNSTPLKVLVTGAAGQLGQALQQPSARVRATAARTLEIKAVSRNELDVGNENAVHALVQAFKPDLILNAAAYTAVDKAESDIAAAELGNVSAPRNLAEAARNLPHTRLIHVSTDFVFDGSESTPYAPDAATAPLGVYGRTKLQGEQAVLSTLGSRALVLRTAWVYAAHGKNFLRTMLRLMNERGAVRVVADQVGTPTCTHSLAEVVWLLGLRPELSGIYHWTDAGVASWYDFAVAIAEEAVAAGLLKQMPAVTPIASHEFPTPVKRPSFSVLDKTTTHTALGLAPTHWRTRLREVMSQVQL